MSIQKKISVSILVFAVVIITVVGSFSIYVSRNTLIDRSKSFLSTIRGGSAYEIERHLFAAKKVTQTLFDQISVTFNSQRDQADQNYRADYLSRIESSIHVGADLSPSKSAFLVLNNFRNKPSNEDIIWYSDIDGDFIPEMNRSTEIIDKIQWQRILENMANDKNPVWVLNADRTAGYCIQAMVENDKVLGVVGNEIGFNEIQSTINATRVMDTGVIFVADAKGQTLFRTGIENLMQGIDLIDLYSETDVHSTFIEKQNDHNDLVLIGSSELSNKWLIGLVVRVDEVTEGLSQIVVMIIGMMVLSLVITVMFSRVVSKKLAEPYIYISDKINAIGHGDYEVTIDEKFNIRSDEVGTLSRSLGMMIQRQKQSFEKIKTQNIELENKVEERTKALKNTIEEITRTRKKLIETEKIASLRYVAIGLAHRMNTPIGNAKIISSYLIRNIEVLSEDLANNNLSKVQLNQFLDNLQDESGSIITNLDVCVDMINKLKEYSSINTQTIVQYADFRNIIYDQNSRVHMAYSKINCELNLQLEDSLNIRCDVYSLKKLMHELMENSYSHAFENIENPEILIKVSNDNSNKECIVLEYSDNGVGVDYKTAKDIFTPMYTSKLSSKFGLGLSMVYALVSDTFEGEIDVDHTLNTGLGFRIKLKTSSQEG